MGRGAGWLAGTAGLEAAVVYQEEVFETGDLGQMRRLPSHLVSAGARTGLVATVSVSLAVATVLVRYAHPLGDAVWDTRQDGGGD